MSQPYKVSAQENSDSLRREAYTIIQHAFNIPQGFDDLSLNRLVDCIISAAVLQVAALQEKAAQQGVHTDPPSALVSTADSTNTAGG